MKRILLSIPALGLAAAAMPAQAGEFFFNFSGARNGSGVLTTTDTSFASRGYTAVTITGIRGTINGLNITGLNGFLGSNNLFYLTGPSVFDGSGLGFTASDGTQSSLYFSLGNYRLTTFTGGLFTGNVAVTSGAVPEPATWATMVLGFLALGVAMRRRRTATPIAAHA